ncbi:MAG: DUF721 domain-containing protein [Planctomycetaceae bacterium]|nr:DUF721 domain-containing protein [Planctomycetaceae bacterium]
MKSTSKRRSEEPQALGDVLSQLFTLRGYDRVQTNRQLQNVWREVAGESLASRTKAQGIKNGVLQVTVNNSATLQELESFHKFSLRERLVTEHSDLSISDIRFRLNSATR